MSLPIRLQRRFGAAAAAGVGGSAGEVRGGLRRRLWRWLGEEPALAPAMMPSKLRKRLAVEGGRLSLRTMRRRRPGVG
jgi:hypothetical protein